MLCLSVIIESNSSLFQAHIYLLVDLIVQDSQVLHWFRQTKGGPGLLTLLLLLLVMVLLQ